MDMVKCKGCGCEIARCYAVQSGVDGYCPDCMRKRGVCPDCNGKGANYIDNYFVQPTPDNSKPLLRMPCKTCKGTGKV